MAKLSDERKRALAKEKPTLLSMWLQLIHSGGDAHVLESFGGYPTPTGARDLEDLQYSARTFLDELNHLGEPS